MDKAKWYESLNYLKFYATGTRNKIHLVGVLRLPYHKVRPQSDQI